MTLHLSEVAVLGACLGVFSHVGFFIRGEYVRAAPRLFLTAILMPPVAIYLLVTNVQLSLAFALRMISVGCGSYLVALFTSMVVYRIFFHPLRHFPGPKLASITQFYHVQQGAAKGNNHLYLERLHAKYGSYVRVGPNLLSVGDPAWVEPIHNRQTHFRKADRELF